MMPVMDHNHVQLLGHVKVTNNNARALVDSHVGVEYTFKPRSTLTIPAEAAAHIFGWSPEHPDDFDRPYLERRWGLNRDKDVADALLGNLVLEGVSSATVTVPAGMTAEEIEDAIARARVQPPSLPMG